MGLDLEHRCDCAGGQVGGWGGICVAHLALGTKAAPEVAAEVAGELFVCRWSGGAPGGTPPSSWCASLSRPPYPLTSHLEHPALPICAPPAALPVLSPSPLPLLKATCRCCRVGAWG